ncbi:MAG: metabolite traffic protein EboE [Actinomycetota bacterium]
MRFRHRDGSTVHLAYCTNVHPAETVGGIVAQLDTVARRVRERLGVATLGVGLWVAAPACAELLDRPDALAAVRGALRRGGLEVVTLNGFPYRAFHSPVVKHAVYRPDWTEPERLDYTRDLAWLLALLLPDDVAEGSISTLPLGWRDGWTRTSSRVARDALARLAEDLARLADATGRRIRVALEPEPGCVVETAAQAAEALAGLDHGWIGVCLDACHLAVGFEDPVAAVAAVRGAGLDVVKAQLSNALRVPDAADRALSATLDEFAEPRFLHQTRRRDAEGEVEGVDDLGVALAGGLPAGGEWRIHFHLPVHAGGERTTQSELEATIPALLDGPAPVTRHLEVETYTWEVLPPERRPADGDGLAAGLAAELAWARDRIVDAGLVAVAA